MNITLPREVAGLLDVFAAHGHTAYVVGGAVRDSLLGRPVHDWDIAAPTSPDETSRLFDAPEYRVIPTGIKHGTVTVLVNGMPIEITTFRIDGDYSDGRHPDAVSFSAHIEDDLARRDLTVNAMAYSPDAGLCDPYGGRADISARLIRCVGDPRRRFTEDALRILRAFRFAAELEYDIDRDTLSAATELSARLSLISAERVLSETVRLFSAPHPSKYLLLARRAGVLERIFPEMTLTDEELSAVDRLPADACLRMGAMLRGAAVRSPEALRSALDGLKMSRVEYRRTYAAATLCLPEPDIVGVRRFLRENGNAADAVAAARACREPGSDEVARLLDEVLAEGGPVTMKTLAVNGQTLKAAGYTDGRTVGMLLKALLDAVTADPTLNNEQTLLALARELKS